MAISQLVFRKGNFIGEIELDVNISESAQTNSIITSNPVESGAEVNDHIIITPKTFQISGVVSNTKVAPLGGLSNILSFTESSSSSSEAWDALIALQEERLPFTLITNLRLYENVVIEGLSTSQDKDTSNALYFTANMKEIIFADTGELSAEQFQDEDTSDKTVPNVEGGLK
jgi:hypothetical protein